MTHHLRPSNTIPNAVIAAIAFSLAAHAQPAQPAYQLTTYIKCKSGKTAACNEYFNGTLHKAMQNRVDKGLISSYILSRLVDPVAAEAGFTHGYTISSDKPIPAEPSEEYRKAGETASGMARDAMLDKLAEIRDVVSRVRTRATTFQAARAAKGDVVRTYYLKAHPNKRAELSDYMVNVRGPYMAQLATLGRVQGWQFRSVMFRGEDDGYDALEHWLYKDGAIAMSAPPPMDQQRTTFLKAFPNGNFDVYRGQLPSLAKVVHIRTSVVLDVIRK